MVKKLLVGCLLFLCITDCFSGYSSGRSGYSGSRSYSSARSSTVYRSTGRSGFSQSTNTRPYVAPRSYSSSAASANSTVIHNNHYTNNHHSGYGSGWGMGGGFFSGMLGGYIGGSLANNHAPVVVANTAPVVAGGGQGMIVEPPVYVPHGYGFMGPIIMIFIIIIGIWVLAAIVRWMFGFNDNERKRW